MAHGEYGIAMHRPDEQNARIGHNRAPMETVTATLRCNMSCTGCSRAAGVEGNG